MRPYEIARDVLERHSVNNVITLAMGPKGIEVKVDVLPNDRPSKFDFLNLIGRGLLEAKLHKDGEPAISGGTFYRYRVWQLNMPGTSVKVVFNMPMISGKHVTVTETPTTMKSVDYKIDWHEAPAIEVPHDDKKEEIPF